MSKRHTSSVWLLTAALFLLLLLGSMLFVYRQGQDAQERTRDDARQEFALLASLVGAQLQRGDYALAEQFLKDWGNHQPQVAGLGLISQSGVSIGEYRRAAPAEELLTLEMPIQYAYTGQARLVLTWDMTPLRARQRTLIVEVAAALGLVAAMLATLTRLLSLYRRESANLQTEIRRSEEARQALRRSEERYTLAARIGRSGAWEIRPREGRIFFDANLTRLLGYEEHELSEDLADWIEAVPDYARGQVTAALQAVADGRDDHYAIEHPVRRKDGSIGWLYAQGQRVSKPGESPMRLVGSSLDISDRKQVEEALELTQFAIDHSSDGVFWFDKEGSVLKANDRACESLGLRLDELIGRHIWDFDPLFAPADWPRLFEHMRRTGHEVFESQHRRKDGSVFPVEISASYVRYGEREYGFSFARDISERKRAEEALRLTQFSLDRAPDGVFWANREGDIEYVNDEACRSLGYSREELAGMRIWDLDPDLRAEQWPGLWEEMRRLRTRTFEARHRHKDGTTHPVEISVVHTTYRDQEHQTGFVRDISQRKEDEILLRQDREQQTVLREMLEDVLRGESLEATLERCMDRLLAVSWLALEPRGGIFLMDGEGQELRLAIARNLSSGVLEQCKRVGLDQCHCGRAAASRAMQFSACVDPLHDIQYPGMADHGHYNLPLLSEGQVLGVMVLYLPPGFRRDVAKEQFLATVADVLAGFIRRKAGENEIRRGNAVVTAVNDAQSHFIAKHTAGEIFNRLLQAFLELSDSEYGFIGEVLRTDDGRPYIKAHGITNIAWNEETRRFFEQNAPAGLDFFKLDNLLGWAATHRRLIIANDPAHDPRSGGLPQGHPPLNSFMGIPFFDGDEVRGIVALANRPDGYDEALLPLLQPLLIASKNIMGSLRVEQQRLAAEAALQKLNDQLEERVRLRTVELLAAKEEAEQASRAKSEFLSRMSHELRTPLNAILGFGQLLEMETRDPEQVDNVHEILHAGRHLLDLINEVLDLARIEAGRMTISQEPVPLMPLVEECLALVRPMAEARGIQIAAAGKDCGEHVLADRTRLKQVLLNLLSNAVKYNRPQGSLGVVCLREGANIQVRVSDSGAGLTPEQQARLFTAFERLDADQSAIEGTGIGLALSKRLVDLMHGEIGVESTPGVGSTFWVRLPGINGQEMPATTVGADEQAAAFLPHTTPRKDVLCIEDNPANLRLIERILARRENVRLLTASAPDLGLELAQAYRPALILLDINLPDMDGYDVMRCLRENPDTRAIPVVAVSANAMPKDLARGKAAGFTDYLTKPLDVDRLLRVVDNVLKNGPGSATS